MNVYGYWDSGLESAPELVKRCFGQWGALNPSYQLKVFDLDGALEILADLPDWVASLPAQALADLLRIRLLARGVGGGIWVDGTSYPVVSLNDWLPEALGPSGFFAFSGPTSSGFRSFDNWFLAVRPGGSKIMEALDSEARAFWSHPRKLHSRSSPHHRKGPRPRLVVRLAARFVDGKRVRWAKAYRRDPPWSVGAEARQSDFYPYFWPHLLVDKLLKEKEEFRSCWDATPVFSHYLTHALQNARGVLPTEHVEFEAALPTLLAASPVHKLNWRLNWSEAFFFAKPNQPVVIPRPEQTSRTGLKG